MSFLPGDPMPVTVEMGTLLQVGGMLAAGVAVWAAMRDQQTEMKAAVKQLEKAADRLERRADRDDARIGKVERRVTKVETLLSVKHDSEPPSSDEDEKG